MILLYCHFDHICGLNKLRELKLVLKVIEVKEYSSILYEVLSIDSDTVVLMYSEGVLGAYDRGDKSNWPMFYFYEGE